MTTVEIEIDEDMIVKAIDKEIMTSEIVGEHLWIWYDGMNIKRIPLESIFADFYRADSKHVQDYAGRGAGLKKLQSEIDKASNKLKSIIEGLE